MTIPKGENTRRKLFIPNPHHQLLLSYELVKYWSELQAFYNQSTISLTKPIIRANSKRAVEREHSFDEITRQRLIKSTSSRYLLKTDVLRYYPTIYTHSISWALHGKKDAKSKKNDKNLLGNILDFNVRNTKEQQTIGIPIGPDTSLIISEIMGTAIDKELSKRIKDLKGFRYVDDIYIYFKSLGKAEEALHHITNIYHEYELELNTEKTRIIELHNEVEPEWISELRLHTVRKSSEKDLISYFSKMFSYAEKYPNDKVIKYGVKRIRGVMISNSTWDIYESCLLKAALADASVLPIILDIFLDYKEMEYDISHIEVEESINYILTINTKFNNCYEIIWSIWILYLLDLELYEKNFINLSQVDDPLVALMILYLIDVKFFENKFDLRVWAEHMKSDELYTDYWILAYEAYKREWLNSKSGKDYITNKKFFDFLRNEDVSFILDVNEHIEEYREEARLLSNYEPDESEIIYYGGSEGY